MRRLRVPTLSVLLLSAAMSSAALADDMKEYRDCLAFADRWCEAAMAEANRFEKLAVALGCDVLAVQCGIELAFGGGGEGAAK